MAILTRIIDVFHKPSKCPMCGGEVVYIIYETGDLTEIEYFFWYRKPAIMGGDNIPRRPPIWVRSNGCKCFRKINIEGTDAPVKVNKPGNILYSPATTFNWQSDGIHEALQAGEEYLKWIQSYMEWGGSIPSKYEDYFLELGRSVRHYGYNVPSRQRRCARPWSARNTLER